MTLHQVLAWSAVLTISFLSPPLSAEPPKALKPVKRHASAAPAIDPFIAAQVQIARLRQTADQLRLLASQSVPVHIQGDTRVEFLKHEEWLRQAGHRVNVLANEWEQRTKPGTSASGPARVADVNAFFESLSAGLQSKLHRESLALDIRSTPARSASDTARLVIGKMN